MQPDVVRTHRLPTAPVRQVKAGATNSQIERQLFFAAKAEVPARSDSTERYGDDVRDGGANVMAIAVTTRTIAWR